LRDRQRAGGELHAWRSGRAGIKPFLLSAGNTAQVCASAQPEAGGRMCAPLPGTARTAGWLQCRIETV